MLGLLPPLLLVISPEAVLLVLLLVVVVVEVHRAEGMGRTPVDASPPSQDSADRRGFSLDCFCRVEAKRLEWRLRLRTVVGRGDVCTILLRV